MKSLFVLRHAKSSWDDERIPDFDRPLNNRGINATKIVGSLIKEKKLQFDAVFCSPARRTRDTFTLTMDAAGLSPKVQYDMRLYAATATSLIEVVSQAGASVKQALLIGHNPGVEELIRMLTGETVGMPTAALACINLDLEDWNTLGKSKGRLEWLVRPKELEK